VTREKTSEYRTDQSALMSIDLTTIPDPLIRALKNRNLVLLIGTGVSRQASETLPVWAELVEEILCLARDLDWLSDDDETYLREMSAQGKYPQVAAYLKANTPGGVFDRVFDRYLKKRFTAEGVRPAPIHRALVKLRTPLVITTNYDLLLEMAYVEVFGKAAEVATHYEAHKVLRVLQTYHESCDPLIFKIHGTALKPEETVLAETDFHQLLYSNPTYRRILETIFLTKVVLILGSSFSDPDVVAVMSEVRTWFPSSQPNYIVLPKTKRPPGEVRRLRQTFGLEIIGYDSSNDRAELLELIEHLASVS
jgi:SIR2-like domain